MSDSDKITVIVSCFNEESVIEECISRTHRTLPGAEVIVICGGKDRTFELASAMNARLPGLIVKRNYGDSGKGHAIKLGITLASRDLIVQQDADLQFMPEEIPKLVAPILAGEADITFGARFMPGSNVTNYKFSLFRVMGNRIVNSYISWLTGIKFHDITTGHKAWTRRAIEAVNFRDNAFLYEMEIAVRGALKGQRIKMVPITYLNRQGGISGHGTGWMEVLSIVTTGIRILLYATTIAATARMDSSRR